LPRLWAQSDGSRVAVATATAAEVTAPLKTKDLRHKLCAHVIAKDNKKTY